MSNNTVVMLPKIFPSISLWRLLSCTIAAVMTQCPRRISRQTLSSTTGLGLRQEPVIGPRGFSTQSAEENRKTYCAKMVPELDQVQY